MLDVCKANLTVGQIAMASDIKIDVTVHVSEMLKAMFGCCNVPEEQPVSPKNEATPDVLADWQTLLLRQDGERPMSFVGMALLQRHCVLEDIPGRIVQTLTIYLAQDRTVIASLTLVPSETCAAWPSFRCQAINSPVDLARFLEAWQPEQCFWQSTSTKASSNSPLVVGPDTARSTFNSMTADCLSPAVLQG